MRIPALAVLIVALGVASPTAQAQDAATQDRVVLSGRVTDAETGEALIGATVYAPGAQRGAATNAYGVYSLPIPAGRQLVVVSYVGYQAVRDTLSLDVDRRYDVELALDAALGEVTVEADESVQARPEDDVQMGQVSLSGKEIRSVPALLGESDVLKAVQLLPGVRGGQEGTAGLYVRGGSPDQTLLLLDGTPVYNASHLFGFLSTFNGDAVNHVELTKGAIPARYGGRLASVLDVRLRDGDMQQRRVQGQVGLLTSRLLVEGPIVTDKASFLVSGRRTYVDVVARPFINSLNAEAAELGNEQVTPHAYFYDLNAKANWHVTERDRLYLSLYGGQDRFGFDTERPSRICNDGQCGPGETEDRAGGNLDWGNLTGAFRYTRLINPRVFGALTLTASRYNFDVGASVEEGVGSENEVRAEARYLSGIRDLAARADFDVAAGRGHALRLGVSLASHRFTPGALVLFGNDAFEVEIDTTIGTLRTYGTEAAVYVEDEWSPARDVTLNLGLHATTYMSGGALYPSLEPRLAASWRARERLALKASFATAQQPLHLLTTAGIGLPADLWVPATERVGPQTGWQAAVGAAGSTASGRTTWTVETYWREMRNLVAYREGSSFVSPFDDWQDLVVQGEGRSIGLEIFLQHRADRLSAWLGYTLARTDRQFDEIDRGNRFPYRYDRAHDVSAVALYELSRAFDVSAAWTYGSGDAVTLPSATYLRPNYEFGGIERWLSRDGQYLSEATAYGDRNGFRLPAYHRLDLGATWYFRRGPRPHALALNIYNAYNRKNPFLTQLDSVYDEETGASEQKLKGITIFPILPTFSYQFSF